MRNALPGDGLLPVQRLHTVTRGRACSNCQRPAQCVQPAGTLHPTAGAIVQRSRTWYTLGDPYFTPTSERFNHQSERDWQPHAVRMRRPAVAADPARQANSRGEGHVQLFAGFIQAYDRARGGIGSLIDISNVFHLGNIRPRRLANAPGRYSPRLDFVFLVSRRP